jgi:hypothetical protein
MGIWLVLEALAVSPPQIMTIKQSILLLTAVTWIFIAFFVVAFTQNISRSMSTLEAVPHFKCPGLSCS